MVEENLFLQINKAKDMEDRIQAFQKTSEATAKKIDKLVVQLDKEKQLRTEAEAVAADKEKQLKDLMGSQDGSAGKLVKLQEKYEKLMASNDEFKKEIEAMKAAEADASVTLDAAWKEIEGRKSLFSFMKPKGDAEQSKDLVAEIRRMKEESEVAAAGLDELKKRILQLQKELENRPVRFIAQPAKEKPAKVAQVKPAKPAQPAAGFDPDQEALIRKLEALERKYQQASSRVDNIKADLVDELKKGSE